MRIISGKYKGRNLNFVSSKITRPLKDSVRENIFNILEHSNKIDSKIINSEILDLYSGTGSFGIECISRGAKKVTFVEKDENAISILKKNLDKLSIKKKALVVENEIEGFLGKKIRNKFDIFFFDPPFNDKSFLENLKVIKSFKNYQSKHILIIHREKTSAENFDNLLKIHLKKEYGRSMILFASFI